MSRVDATSLVAGHLRLSKQQQIIPISMKSETGRRDVYASFYVYSSLENAQQQLPRYIMLRNMSKEDRKKIISEEKATKMKAKQAAAAEVKRGKGKR
jgi:ribosomal protein S24E